MQHAPGWLPQPKSTIVASIMAGVGKVAQQVDNAANPMPDGATQEMATGHTDAHVWVWHKICSLCKENRGVGIEAVRVATPAAFATVAAKQE